MKSVKTLSFEPDSSAVRFKLSFGLMAAIWILGLVGHFTPLQEWPALALYVLGSIGLVIWRGKAKGEWKETYLAGGDLKKSLKLGLIWGIILLVIALVNTIFAYKYQDGLKMMSGMEYLLVHRSLLYLFPVLVIAEEFLWRGIMFSALREKGINKHLIVAITTLLFVLNHYAVAPVDIKERALMAMMAFPIGIAGGYLVLFTKNVWGSVVMHLILMIGMMIALLVNIPA